MNSQIIAEYKDKPKAKIILVLLLILLSYSGYRLYVWSKTQTTDNAYTEADISQISCEVKGVIKNILVKDNSPVKSGDVIAEIDDSDYLASLAQINAKVKAAEENVKALDKQLEIAKLNLEKTGNLLEFTQTNLSLTTTNHNRSKELKKDNFASQQLVDQTRLAFEKSKFDYEQAVLDVDLSKRQIALLELQKASAAANLEASLEEKKLVTRALANTKLISPIDGKFFNNGLRVGNYVYPGLVLYSVVPDKLYIKANFKETQIVTFKAGHNVELEFDAVPNKKFKGVIRNISPATGSKFTLIPPDNATGNFTKIVQRVPVLIDFELPSDFSGTLTPGMSTSVSISVDQ